MALVSFGRVAWIAIFVHKRDKRPSLMVQLSAGS